MFPLPRFYPEELIRASSQPLPHNVWAKTYIPLRCPLTKVSFRSTTLPLKSRNATRRSTTKSACNPTISSIYSPKDSQQPIIRVAMDSIPTWYPSTHKPQDSKWPCPESVATNGSWAIRTSAGCPTGKNAASSVSDPNSSRSYLSKNARAWKSQQQSPSTEETPMPINACCSIKAASKITFT